MDKSWLINKIKYEKGGAEEQMKWLMYMVPQNNNS